MYLCVCFFGGANLGTTMNNHESREAPMGASGRCCVARYNWPDYWPAFCTSVDAIVLYFGSSLALLKLEATLKSRAYWFLTKWPRTHRPSSDSTWTGRQQTLGRPQVVTVGSLGRRPWTGGIRPGGSQGAGPADVLRNRLQL